MGYRSFVGVGFGSTINFSTTKSYASFGTDLTAALTEDAAEFKVSIPGTFSRPSITVTTTAGTTRTTGLRKNNADAISWAFGDGASGGYVDTSGAAGSASVVADDRVCFFRSTSAGTGTVSAQGINFEPSGATAVTLFAAGGPSGITFGGLSSSRSVPIAGFSSLFADANQNARTKIDVSGVAQGFFVWITANAATTDTLYTLYVNGSATSAVITVPGGATGLHEHTGTVSVSAGDALHWRQTNGSGGANVTHTIIGFSLEATSGAKSNVVVRFGSGATRTNSATPHFIALTGRGNSTVTSEAATKVKLGFPARLSSIRQLTATVAYDNVITVRVNGVDTALACTQATGASGWAENNTDTVDVSATDELSISWAGNSATGANVLHAVVLTVEDLTPPPATGTTSGSSAVSGQARAITTRTGTTSGSSTVSGDTLAPPAVGTLSGSSTVSGDAGFNLLSIGSATGSSTVSGDASYAVTYIGPEGEAQTLQPSNKIELFELDATVLGGTIYRFHAGKNGLLADIVWNGQTYAAFPVQATGFEHNGKGPLPRPKFAVSNVLGTISALVHLYDDLAGCRLTRIRTLAKFLDAVNFPGGVNPTADPDAEYPREVYLIDRKSAENEDMVEFELASSLDMAGVAFPSRQVIQNYCPWAYRGSECGYTGTEYFDTNDQVVASLGQDVCGKRLSSCRKRFGQYGELPYGGFPAAGLLRL